MQAYRIETTVQKDGTLTLDHLPFHAGEEVEIIVLTRTLKNEKLSLRGTPVVYVDPTEPVAHEDWDASQ